MSTSHDCPALPAVGRYPAVTAVDAAPSGVGTILVGLFADEDCPELPASSLLSEDQTRQVYEDLAAVGAKGTHGELTRIPAPVSADAAVILAVGLGEAEDMDDERLRRAAGIAARSLRADESVATTLTDLGAEAVAEGLVLGGYSYPGIHGTAAPAQDKAGAASVALVGVAPESVAAALETSATVNFVRDLVNTPANLLYPESYAALVAEHAKKAGLEVEVLDEQQLAEQGFGGILAVGQGSARPPRLVRLTWTGSESGPFYALVGKGITFDTGGISLKPASKMENMISDMGGSAAVVGAALTAARLQLPIKLTATIALAENMPSGSATRPGDVVTHYGGVTTEVINTDAEGRLVLGDAMARACEDNPDFLIDTATLTGAQIVALGERTAGVMGTARFRDAVAAAGREVGEQAWAMPMLEEHEKELKSFIADIRNVHNSRSGGMEYAASYLSTFVAEGIEWAHVDVAGPSWNDAAPHGYTPKRATGAPMRTIVKVLRDAVS
ncbi:leucyl aminopeptidase [Corynebacterium uterequi]|uniref:Probable cytosol aminopeptidase n=1 Tax=Corynebacterium uterequi TaxID=1072256 RepID=A0A0G3HK25_9CORY|nr:leucyl aminopeptidase [Corynebacterium uterequi]AKK11502.1 leucyl aminopeptidase [Corynebacterium uterequi]